MYEINPGYTCMKLTEIKWSFQQHCFRFQLGQASEMFIPVIQKYLWICGVALYLAKHGEYRGVCIQLHTAQKPHDFKVQSI